MREILNDNELEEIYKKRIGFVFNDYTKSPNLGTQQNKLHKADCSYMNPSNKNRLKTEGESGKLPKIYFDTEDEANNWLKNNRSDVGYSDCGVCMGK